MVVIVPEISFLVARYCRTLILSFTLNSSHMLFDIFFFWRALLAPFLFNFFQDFQHTWFSLPLFSLFSFFASLCSSGASEKNDKRFNFSSNVRRLSNFNRSSYKSGKRKLNECLAGLSNVVCILVFGKNTEEHNEMLQKLLLRCSEKNMKPNREKCVFNTSTI